MWKRHREIERQAPPAWPSEERGARPRVLIEHPDPAAQDVLARGLREHGYDVVTCGGPRAAGMTEVSCPLLRQEPCEAAIGADVVVSGLSLHSTPERMIIRRLTQDARVGDLLLEASEREAVEILGPEHAEDVTAPLTVGGIVSALEQLTS